MSTIAEKGKSRGAREQDAPQTVIRFWRDAGPCRWFAKNPAFDGQFRARFIALNEAAARGELDHWRTTANGALALLILLDQFPRNAFRHTARMYATDALALDVAHQAIATGFDHGVSNRLALFFYLPFAHAEDSTAQDVSVRFNRRLGKDYESHAIGHRDIIRRFGRFPHRNALLNRTSTVEEIEFLRNGGFAG